jgi:hypothetical protein
MSKLGFTFYPKDWWTSDTFFELEPVERYFFLEFVFLMYQNDGYLTYSKEQIEVRLRTQIKPKIWEKITQLLTQTDLGYTLDSVKKRRSKAETSRENGKKGGRPPKPKNPEINLPLEREREREYKLKESESKKETQQHSQNHLDLTQFVNPDNLTEEQKRERMIALHDELKNSGIWLNDVSRITHTKESETWHTIKIFLDELKAKDDFYKSIREVKKHCISWIRKYKPAL